MPIKRQSSTNPSHSDANPSQSDANPVPIRCQTNSNPSQLPKSTQCRSKSIAYQMPIPPKGNILPIPYQSANCMSILSLSPNPMPICQHIHPLTIQRIVIPIHCRSANPSKSIDPLPVNKVINISPINSQSHANSISICKSITNQSIIDQSANPMSILMNSLTWQSPLPIQCHKDHTKITKTALLSEAIIKKGIDTGLARIGTTSRQSFTNRRTVVHVIFELVYYRGRLLVSAEDDFAPPAGPVHSSQTPILD